MQVNLRRGIECWFDVDDITIRLWASAWTGREVVRIEADGIERVVSDRRNLRFDSPHEFQYAGQHYRLELSMRWGRTEIRLYRNGVLIDSDQYSAPGVRVDPRSGRIDWLDAVRRLLPAVLLGGLAGAAFGYLLGSWLK